LTGLVKKGKFQREASIISTNHFARFLKKFILIEKASTSLTISNNIYWFLQGNLMFRIW